MARYALIFSILIGLGAAFLGYKATEQAKVLQTDLSSAKADRDTAKTQLKKKEGELADAKKAQADAEDAQKKAETDLATAKMEADKAKADLAKAEAAQKEAEQNYAAAKADLDKINEIFKDVKPDELRAKIAELNDAKTKLETELSESKQVQAALQKKADEAEAQFAAKDRAIKEYKDQYVRNGLQGKVLAYNPGWNFVVVNIGDKAGLKSGVQMVVTRAGAMIGKVKVSTVEPSTAIADVLPGTLARGESVQPGDTVIYEGTR